METILVQQAVGQPGQRVVQRALTVLVGCRLRVLTSLGVDQVGGRDVGQRLRGLHGVGIEAPGRLAVQVQRTEAMFALVQWEGEDRAETSLDRRRGEGREPRVARHVVHPHRRPGVERQHAWPLPDVRLETLVAHRPRIGRGDEARLATLADQGHPGGGDRQDAHDLPDQVIEDLLDREVGRQGARELAQHRGQLHVVDHEEPNADGRRMEARARSGRMRCSSNLAHAGAAGTGGAASGPIT
ncbi:MAG: hypothetical protein JJT89_01815 [Nitriliruptoraceae bacterium]|nr:hypothetical protein [Nitriliruptoraceae bacterium]